MDELRRNSIPSILIIEDNYPDFESIIRVFKKIKLNNPIFRCEDGKEAFDYLYRKNKYIEIQTSPRPGLILLDLNLPGIDGREVLKKIKTDLNLKSIPVIILTSSDSDTDVSECYLHGANSYMTKNADWDIFSKNIESLKLFWLETAILPNNKI